MPYNRPGRFHRAIFALSALVTVTGCATIGSMMSPYSEKFSCKNDDHGQCIHPERAYEDAVAGTPSKSDPRVTNDKAMLHGKHAMSRIGKGVQRAGADAWGSYRDSVYQELKGLIDAPTTPMLKPARTVRTLILPYADRQRPDRLYMPRYVYSVVDRPVWVVGGALIASPAPASRDPVLGQRKEPQAAVGDAPAPSPIPSEENRP
ncbi:TraV family lipoprotein [Sphingobium sp. EM0848]|uniref:TraV family lipoprotein n=1 Tax=Sphingobium sp. EM0848 TaxID=2743473 RepID=UPI00159C1E05|nr:TraV family lipoprotein [Sphingobium sp. EM0848]